MCYQYFPVVNLNSLHHFFKLLHQNKPINNDSEGFVIGVLEADGVLSCFIKIFDYIYIKRKYEFEEKSWINEENLLV